VRENKWAGQPGTFCGLLFLFSAKDGVPVAMIKEVFSSICASAAEPAWA
jgi:hypothetical protein